VVDPIVIERARSVVFKPGNALLLVVVAGAAAAWSPWALLFLLQVSALIVVHEGGHMLVARRCGMAVTEFFVGFGPVIVSVERGGTTWGLKALPIGGFVKIPGMSSSEEVDPALEPRTYRAATLPRRLATVLAGPAANILAAVVIFSVAAFVMADPSDRPLGADGTARTTVTQGLVPALADGIDLAVDTSTATFEGFVAFVQAPFGTATTDDGSEVENRFLSPVGASQFTQWTAESDPLIWLEFVGLISVSLAVANAMPFPPLDGGHAVTAVLETGLSRVRRRKVAISTRVTNTVAWVTLAFFAFITVGSLVLDVTDPLDNPFAPAPAAEAPEIPAG
jgi:membrane-associated protease RseP (regulator of RpoE activity)